MTTKNFEFYTQYGQFYLSSDNGSFLDENSTKNGSSEDYVQSLKERLALEKNALVIFTQSYGDIKGKIEVLEKSNTNEDLTKYDHVVEGGKGANVAAVPIIEQSYQGADLRWNVYANLKSGDAFMVIPVPEGREPETVKQEALSRLPQSAPILSPAGSPNFSRPAVPYNLWPAVLGAGVAIGVGMYMRFVPIP